jgi:hypothetical protein
MWVATVVVLMVSFGETAAQPKSGEPAAQPKQILFLHPYGQNFQTWITWKKEIRNELSRQSPWSLDIQEHSLVTARSGDAAAEAKFVEYLNALYAQRPPDLIVAIGGPAARFVQQYRADLFPTTPMLLAVVEERRVEQSMLSEQDAVVGVRFARVREDDRDCNIEPPASPYAIMRRVHPYRGENSGPGKDDHWRA